MTLTQAGDTVAKNVQPTQHWRTTYKSVIETAGEKERITSRRPLWSINRVAYSSGIGYYDSEFRDAFGAKSFKLREKDQAREDLLDRRAKELYNGEYPTFSFLHLAKQNIADNY